ncbi:TenA family transcriptional regulator [Mycolicibacterium mageritense DSM 44476 = CIP 104973]|uniref:Aminopyrimidine aminohydrolase n=1 Tax=Mycolicibacterium mageritense TaxID=53462 RepID=A0AAI8U114_MYCME|nr:thiaminase II [Mycolicibacterium mageritense]MBN3454583.1 thiaminase II [Mycobacterium sp. DSM 3803]OKH76929.1 TenA family transcriptional regulator [Mycobacterium sp. SWH-M3]MCC9185392.1 thiaminase II [Mycolicibacterium mageritense]TXI65098.1 MAG: thiaminase II [Mycolicibacterium mageritense]CDO26103.1 TenA family transcriptional regulator [Mycolicibacterium mageritense DSM 44476 = CIP 104973]
MHSAPEQQTWSARLWHDVESTFAAILAHPFVTGLTDGTLDDQVFAHYVAQDVHYLRDYARALAIVGAKAPTLADTAMFSRHAAEVFDVELQLHDELLPQLGLDPATLDAAPVAPTTRAYTSYLIATAYSGSFADGLAAVLPCYWIYAKVGAQLLEHGSPDRRYQSWIDSYGGEEFATTVAEVLAVTDRTGPTLTAADEAVARAHFTVTARYEWMFFDAAYRREQWPV